MATQKNEVIHTVTARETGTKIEIVKLGKPEGEHGWAAYCEHGARTTVKTRRMAHEAGRTPKAWCQTCKKGGTTKKVRMPAPHKATAKKATPAPAKKATTRATAKAGAK